MKFATLAALLPAFTLANGQAGFFGNATKISGPCDIDRIVNTERGQQVFLRNYRATIVPADVGECVIDFKIQHPRGPYSVRIGATHHVKSTIPAGVSGFLWRNYVVSPGSDICPRSFNRIQLPTGVVERDYPESFSVTTGPHTEPSTNYRWSGRLQLQGAQGAQASIEQTSVKLEILSDGPGRICA
ncbi:hypothetical protein QBC38DRAFT_459907 [Podospora fimiseda]|uniref:Ubiquitin 3 binding protein But2 C-terminal domain-containing protein n=1 Tax=Podospora fimiseda TaxID=252190 RepID=A0AAN6YU16_9PEZI|nr:hypothetical protein QBC38DRAFT_459907 [Podospora fimiseda]